MNTFDPVLETRVLKSILEKKDPTFIVNLSSDWFGLPIAREIWERVTTLRNNGKQIPSLQTFTSDPVLSEGAQTLLKGDVPGFESHEVEHAMEQLNYYRQGRILGAVSKKVTELLVPQQGDITQAKVIMERGLAALQNADLMDDLLTYGFNNEKTTDFYEEVMNQTVQDRFIQTGLKFIDKQQGGLGRGRLYTIGAPSGGGKCFARDTPIFLANGQQKKVQDIVVGDEVMGPDSTPRRVIGLARGQEDMFEIQPTKGEPFTVNASHVLSLRRTDSRWGQRGKIVNLSVQEYLAKSKTFKTVTKLYRTGVEFSEQDPQALSIEPYILGIFLGDGARHNKKITTSDPQIIQRLQNYAKHLGCDLTTRPATTSFSHYFSFGFSGGNDPRKNPVLETFKNCIQGENKKIPPQYLVASRGQRLELLAGLLDTDGHLHHNFYEILTKFEPLKQDILFLARSLGFAAYFSEKYVETQKGLQKYYRITISGNVNEIPCIVPRKKASPRGQIKDVLNVGFEVQPLGIGEYFGFELEGPDRLFLLGDFTVTHNSTLANQIAINAHLGGLTPHEVFVKGIVPTQCYSVNYNTFEMGKEECLLRNQPNLTRIPSNRFQLQSLTPAERKKSDQIFARFLAHGEKFGKRLEYNCPSRDINISQLITAIEPMSFDIVVVDYINLMSYINPKESMWWNIGEAFRLMKRFAERTRSAVIMVVQIDEETKNIKYAKSIRHHSDGVWLWDWNDAIKEAGGLVEVDQNKLRNFAPCKFNLQAEFEYCAFSESFGSGADPTGSPAPSSLKPMTL